MGLLSGLRDCELADDRTCTFMILSLVCISAYVGVEVELVEGWFVEGLVKSALLLLLELKQLVDFVGLLSLEALSLSKFCLQLNHLCFDSALLQGLLSLEESLICLREAFDHHAADIDSFQQASLLVNHALEVNDLRLDFGNFSGSVSDRFFKILINMCLKLKEFVTMLGVNQVICVTFAFLLMNILQELLHGCIALFLVGVLGQLASGLVF